MLDRHDPRILTQIGGVVLRYSLVFFFVAFGLYKFTPQEAAGIQPLTEHSLLLSWVNPLLGVQGGSNLIGLIEIATGVLIALRHFAPRLSGYGSLLAAFALVNTLSFLFTTPGLDPKGSDVGFLLKDLTLLGAAVWSAGEAFASSNIRRHLHSTQPVGTAASTVA